MVKIGQAVQKIWQGEETVWRLKRRADDRHEDGVANRDSHILLIILILKMVKIGLMFQKIWQGKGTV